jgi:ribosome maturation factor RimP
MANSSQILNELLTPAVAAAGCELLGIEYIAQGRHSLLRVYIDKPEGITVEDCERVSHQISGVLDVEDPIQGAYSLEVSSPGLDRPLFTPQHYLRFCGSLVQLRLNQPVNGRRKVKGRLLRVNDDEVVLDMEGEELTLSFASIDKGNLVVEW